MVLKGAIHFLENILKLVLTKLLESIWTRENYRVESRHLFLLFGQPCGWNLDWAQIPWDIPQPTTVSNSQVTRDAQGSSRRGYFCAGEPLFSGAGEFSRQTTHCVTAAAVSGADNATGRACAPETDRCAAVIQGTAWASYLSLLTSWEGGDVINYMQHISYKIALGTLNNCIQSCNLPALSIDKEASA